MAVGSPCLKTATYTGPKASFLVSATLSCCALTSSEVYLIVSLGK